MLHQNGQSSKNGQKNERGTENNEIYSGVGGGGGGRYRQITGKCQLFTSDFFMSRTMYDT